MEIEHPGGAFGAARHAIALVAARQHGVISTRQLRAVGLSPRGIAGLVSRGHLHRIHRGVYAVGHTALTLHGRWMAAVLACGTGALLSHHPAAALHELRTNPSGLIDVTAPTKRHHRGVRSHTTRAPILAADRTTIDGLPVTSLERTLLDYAEIATPRRLDEALSQCERSERLNVIRLEATLARNPGRHGAKALATALAQHQPEDPRLRSQLEKLLLARFRAAGVPEPQCNVYVDGILVDFYWPQADLIVEIDGYTHHRGRRSFEDDRRRDGIHTVAGRRTLRLTAARLEHDIGSILDDVRHLLALAAAGGVPVLALPHGADDAQPAAVRRGRT